VKECTTAIHNKNNHHMECCGKEEKRGALWLRMW